jgi:hypothetical protein
MAVPARLALFATVLVAVFALSFGVGRAMDDGAPVSPAADADGHDMDDHRVGG